MNDSNMTGTGIRNTVPQDSTNKETKTKTTRSAIGAKAQTILDFLRRRDALRGGFHPCDGRLCHRQGDTETIEATDQLAVNRFLNHGLIKENGTSNETVMRHRQERAQKLMEAVKEFVNIGQLCRVSVALMKISSDFKAVEDARQHLQSQPPTTAGRS